MTEVKPERVAEAFSGLASAAADFKTSFSLAFSKCPHCSTKLVSGYWLKWCGERACQGFAGPK